MQMIAPRLLALWLVALLNSCLVYTAAGFDCQSILGTTSEKAAFSLVKSAFNDGESFDIKCLENTCQKHYFKLSEFLIEDYYSKNDIDTLEVIDKQIAILNRNQSSLHKELAREDRDLLIIKPAFKWAQSLDNVFIETKFSHRLDAPACVDTFDQKIKITESYVNLTAKCRRGDDTLLYQVYLNLFDKINVKESKWEKQAMGRIYINLKKKISPNRWTKLYLNEEEKPGKAYLWKEIHEKHEEKLDEYAKRFREEDDDYDEFDRFVAGEVGRYLPSKPLKFGKTQKIETQDITDQVQAVDVTEEMRAHFESPQFREQLLSGRMNYQAQQDYDYEEIDQDEYDHLEREDLEETEEEKPPEPEEEGEEYIIDDL